MALKLRRGLNSQRLIITPEPGELLYVTDNAATGVSPLFVGDGSTAGGFPVANVISVNSQTGEVELTTDNITEGDTPTNLWFTEERAQDAAASLFASGVHTGVTFTYGTTQDGNDRIDVNVAASGTVSEGTAGALGYWTGTDTTINPIPNLTWDELTSTLTAANGGLTITAGNGNRALISLNSNYVSGTSPNSIIFNRGRNGTDPVAVNDSLGAVLFQGWDGDQNILSCKLGAFVLDTVSDNIVPTGFSISTCSSTGEFNTNFRVFGNGKATFGPAAVPETGTGQIRIVSTANPSPSGPNVITDSVLAINTHFDGQDGQNISIARARGTFAAPAAVQSGDDLIDMSFFGYDGTGYINSAQITASVDGAVSTGVVKGTLKFAVRSSSTVSNFVTTITSDGKLTQTGVVKSNVALQTAVYASTAARDLAIPSPEIGMIIFNTETGKFEGNTGGTTGTWSAFN